MRKSAGDMPSLWKRPTFADLKHQEITSAFAGSAQRHSENKDISRGRPKKKRRPFDGTAPGSEWRDYGKRHRPKAASRFQDSLDFSRCKDQKAGTSPIAKTTRQRRKSLTASPSTKASALRNGLRV